MIVGSGVAIGGKLLMVLLYNAAFLAPIAAILVTLLVLGDDAKQPSPGSTTGS